MTQQEQDHYTLPPESPIPESVRKETEMRKAFWVTAADVLSNPDRFVKTDGVIRIGLEFEYSVLTSNYEQASEADRNAIIAANPDFTDAELGAAQLEWRTDPIDVSKGFNELEGQIEAREKQLRQTAQSLGVSLLRSGSNPLVKIDQIVRTDKLKYRQVPNFHNDNKRFGLDTHIGLDETVDVRDAAVCSIINSVQCNLEASGFDDAIDKLNRSFAIGPMAVALSGNSRFLESKDTGIADTRMIAWEVSHDTRTALESEEGRTTRVGLPGLYYQDMRDYFQRVSAFPFILDIKEAAFPIGQGLNWKDTRIKVVGEAQDSLVVEFRPVSVQPTVQESTAMMIFYLGRLLWSQQQQEPLMNLKAVKENRDQAMKFGMHGLLWVQVGNHLQQMSAGDALALELDRAMIGLDTAGIPETQYTRYYEILSGRIDDNKTPSDRLASAFHEARNKGIDREEAMILALNETKALI